MPRYVVVLPLELLAAGDRFLTRDWPLHVTIVPVFSSAATAADVAAALTGERLTVTAAHDERFGAGESIPVTVIEPAPPILELHRRLLAALAPLEAVIESPRFAGDGFRPHVTIKRFGRVHEGDVLELAQLALVDMEPGQPEGARRVLATRELSTAL
jgi:2'-5' RNA ligase